MTTHKKCGSELLTARFEKCVGDLGATIYFCAPCKTCWARYDKKPKVDGV